MPDIQEDVMRELMRDATADLFAPRGAAAGALRHQRRRQFRNRLAGAGAAAAAAGLAVGVVVTTSGGAGAGTANPGGIHATLTAAQQTLYSLSSASAAGHHTVGRYVVLTEKSVSTDGAGRYRSSETGAKTSVISTVDGSVVTYQDLAVSAPTGTPAPPAVLRSGPGSEPTQAQLDAMPTGVQALRADLLIQARRQIALEQQQVQLKLKKGVKAAPISQSTSDDLVFSSATDLLWQPNLSPALRSALYKVLASTPGVTVNAHSRDSAGRPAIEISRVDSGKTDVIAFENPKNGATLETLSRGANGDLAGDVYLSVRYANSVPADPYRH